MPPKKATTRTAAAANAAPPASPPAARATTANTATTTSNTATNPNKRKASPTRTAAAAAAVAPSSAFALLRAPSKPTATADLNPLNETCTRLIAGLLCAVKQGIRKVADFKQDFGKIHSNYWLSYFLSLSPNDSLERERVTLAQFQRIQIAFVLALEYYLKEETGVQMDVELEVPALEHLIKTLEEGRWDKKSNDFYKLHVELKTQLYVASCMAAEEELDPAEFFTLPEGYYSGSMDQSERNHKKMLSVRGKKFKDDIAKGLGIEGVESVDATFGTLEAYLTRVYEAVETRVIQEGEEDDNENAVRPMDLTAPVSQAFTDRVLERFQPGAATPAAAVAAASPTRRSAPVAAASPAKKSAPVDAASPVRRPAPAATVSPVRRPVPATAVSPVLAKPSPARRKPSIINNPFPFEEEKEADVSGKGKSVIHHPDPFEGESADEEGGEKVLDKGKNVVVQETAQEESDDEPDDIGEFNFDNAVAALQKAMRPATVTAAKPKPSSSAVKPTPKPVSPRRPSPVHRQPAESLRGSMGSSPPSHFFPAGAASPSHLPAAPRFPLQRRHDEVYNHYEFDPMPEVNGPEEPLFRSDNDQDDAMEEEPVYQQGGPSNPRATAGFPRQQDRHLTAPAAAARSASAKLAEMKAQISNYQADFRRQPAAATAAPLREIPAATRAEFREQTRANNAQSRDAYAERGAEIAEAYAIQRAEPKPVRGRKRWTDAEVRALEEGMSVYGTKWNLIEARVEFRRRLKQGEDLGVYNCIKTQRAVEAVARMVGL
ncbi:hypothetical protein HDU98_003949 [Podochytrium sp. JEL0797]|nr:hypothetical protein HDU98_003949 [Podochytrium sp. JEL0797]